MKKSLIALSAIGMVFTATPAFAGGVEVEYRDLNLANAAGQQALERRIDRAAKEVCELNTVKTGSRLISADARQCYREAKKQAKRQLASNVDRKQLGG